MYVEKIAVRNFRCFAEAEIELNYPGRKGTKKRPVPKRNKNVNLFLGGNGSGKSSVFKAVALGVLAPVMRSSGFQAEFLVRREPGEDNISITNPQQKSNSLPTLVKSLAEISVILKLNKDDLPPPHADISQAPFREPVIGETTLQRIGEIEDISTTENLQRGAWMWMSFNDRTAFFIVGYGANRRTERPESYSERNRSPRYQRVASLFEEQTGLVPFTYGYLQLSQRDNLKEARSLLNSLLPEGFRLTEKADSQGRVLFDCNGVLLPFNALSDGYRTFVGWVWDLLFQLARVGFEWVDYEANLAHALVPLRGEAEQSLTDISGVVIVDEIDLFLHPEWQRVVIDRIAEAFPNLQFLFSTHSPLVAGSLEPENIFVLETAPDGTATVAQYQEDIHGLTANQVLTSSYFGLNSTRAPGTGDLSDLAKRKIATDMLDEIEEIEAVEESPAPS